MEDVLISAARKQYEAYIEDVADLEPSWDQLPESHKDRLVRSLACALSFLPGVLELGWRSRCYMETGK